jgi:hypothetical protein
MEKNNGPGYWDELKSRLKKKYPQLATWDFYHKKGEEERMMRVIEYKLRKSKEQMKEIIKSL